jgi:hypothetical protein
MQPLKVLFSLASWSSFKLFTFTPCINSTPRFWPGLLFSKHKQMGGHWFRLIRDSVQANKRTEFNNIVCKAEKMKVSLTIVRYRRRFIPFAFFAMALFRLPLWRNKNISFFKLMGCGKNGTFDKTPDLQQWAIMAAGTGLQDSGILEQKDYISKLYGSFIAGWLKLFGCEVWTVLLEPTEGHGTWDGKTPFGNLPKQTTLQGPVAVLTRATIRISRLKQFWANVDGVAVRMAGAEGFVTSLGIGEVPWIKQATFSIWQSREVMRNFAYKMKEHADVVRKTHTEKWYSEDMFVRFSILGSTGTIKKQQPLEGILPPNNL